MSRTYWGRVVARRVSRRRGLVVASGGAAAIALLAACGRDGDSDESSPSDTSGLLSPVVDDTKDLKRGGALKLNLTSDVQTFDPHTTSLPNQTATTLAYSQLFRIVDGYMSESKGEIEGDVVESWEFSGDRTTLTAKINPNAHFAPLAPVNGRSVDAQDVAFTWERFKAQATRRADIVNEVNPDAPVVSITAPDTRTIVMKLSEPNATLLGIFAQIVAGSFYVLPKEAADQAALDLRRTQLGTGAWYLENYSPSISLTFKRNPAFGQDKRGVPYIDALEYPIIGEYAAQLAQFKAGAIHNFPALRAEDILQTKSEVPELELLPGDLASAGTRNFLGVGQDSPFRDERVRQAWSMAQDRDLFIDVIYNVSGYTGQGLPVTTAWDTALPASAYAGWWIDPTAKDFGANSKYYAFNLDEAKKLLNAAGYAGGVDVNAIYPQTGYSANFYKHVEIVLGMVQDAGFRPKISLVNFNTEWNTYREIKGQFSGTAFITDSGGADPANFLYAHYNSKGSLFQAGDAMLDDFTSKMRRELDDKKRQSLVHDLQKYEAGKIFYPRVGGGASGFQLAWPAMRNRQVYRGGTGRTNATFFLDPERPPFKRA